jgi:tetratricopeptide (TPR) repeat protein
LLDRGGDRNLVALQPEDLCGADLLGTPATGEALQHYTAALKLEPDNVACLINYAWILAADEQSEIRRPDRAIEVAQRAVTVTQTTDETVLALDALAAALASAGRFDAAVAVCRRALALAGNSAMRNGLTERLSLYLRQRPFVVTHSIHDKF